MVIHQYTAENVGAMVPRFASPLQNPAGAPGRNEELRGTCDASINDYNGIISSALMHCELPVG